MNRFIFIILISLFTLGSAKSHGLDYSIPYDREITNPDKRNQRSELVAFAKTFLGTSYKSRQYCSNGFDCSGFVQYVYQHFDINLSRTSTDMAKQGRRRTKPIEGDLVFFSSGRRIQHVGIVTHTDKRGIHIIHSTSSRGIIEECIQESQYWKPKYAFAKDVILSKR